MPPWSAQPPLRGCHKGTFSGPPTPLRAQLGTQATALVWVSSSPAFSPEGGCLKQWPNCRVISFDFCATWTVRMASSPLILFYSPSWAWLFQVPDQTWCNQLLWRGMQPTGGTKLHFSPGPSWHPS